jgi:type II secretory pathway pseudopilin PulG
MTQDELLTIKRLGQRANEQRANDQRPTTNDQPSPAARHPHPGRPRRAERGYILLMLMLIVTLLAIAAGALAPTIAFQVRRDREEEMVHRGVQYSRAIRRYVKKTGRYPTRLEDLENTNNVRFLRKRYKDPITNADFKLLHVGDVQLTGVAGIAGAAAIGGGTIPGASPLGAGSLNASVSASSPGPGTQGAGLVNASSPGAAAGLLLGGSPGQAPGAAAPGNAAGTAADNSGSADSSDQTSSDQSSTFQAKMGQSKTGQSGTDSDQSGTSTDKLSSQVFGGGPIVGVASTSKAATIREYNHKNHYNQWQFIYDPTMERGGLITTPAQPALQVAAPLQQQNGSSSSGQNPSSFGASGFSGGPQTPPPAQPTQQQQ